MNNPKIYFHTHRSETGAIDIASIDDKICLCEWRSGKCRDSVKYLTKTFKDAEIVYEPSKTILKTINEIEQYLSGKLKTFSIEAVNAGTQFQQTVWDKIKQISYGSTITYKELAKQIGREKAIRAVANATGANRLAMIVPCHRIVGTNGSLTGYAGGIEIKQRLLEIEKGIKSIL